MKPAIMLTARTDRLSPVCHLLISIIVTLACSSSCNDQMPICSVCATRGSRETNASGPWIGAPEGPVTTVEPARKLNVVIPKTYRGLSLYSVFLPSENDFSAML